MLDFHFSAGNLEIFTMKPKLSFQVFKHWVTLYRTDFTQPFFLFSVVLILALFPHFLLYFWHNSLKRKCWLSGRASAAIRIKTYLYLRVLLWYKMFISNALALRAILYPMLPMPMIPRVAPATLTPRISASQYSIRGEIEMLWTARKTHKHEKLMWSNMEEQGKRVQTCCATIAHF